MHNATEMNDVIVSVALLHQRLALHEITISTRTFSYTGHAYDWGLGVFFTPNIYCHMARVENLASQLNKFQHLLRERAVDFEVLQPHSNQRSGQAFAMSVEVEDLHTKSMGWVMEMWKIGELFYLL
ncbi:MAG: hypothetical protein Q9174_006387 [Haloplaca sp. 1 TL-2023]